MLRFRLFLYIWLLILISFLLIGCGGEGEEGEEDPTILPPNPVSAVKTIMPVICTTPGNCT